MFHASSSSEFWFRFYSWTTCQATMMVNGLCRSSTWPRIIWLSTRPHDDELCSFDMARLEMHSTSVGKDNKDLYFGICVHLHFGLDCAISAQCSRSPAHSRAQSREQLSTSSLQHLCPVLLFLFSVCSRRDLAQTWNPQKVHNKWRQRLILFPFRCVCLVFTAMINDRFLSIEGTCKMHLTITEYSNCLLVACHFYLVFFSRKLLCFFFVLRTWSLLFFFSFLSVTFSVWKQERQNAFRLARVFVCLAPQFFKSLEESWILKKVHNDFSPMNSTFRESDQSEATSSVQCTSIIN